MPGSSVPEGFPKNLHARGSLDQPQANLKEAVGLDLDTAGYRLGAKLDFDPATEKFVGNDDANAMLTRRYRAPFVVTEVA